MWIYFCNQHRAGQRDGELDWLPAQASRSWLYDHKQWSKADMFDMFISPERNSAKRLQKERFNSLVYSFAIAIHLDEKVTQFLLKYDHITNQLACICWRFENLDFVHIMAAIGVIVGIHLVEPFISVWQPVQRQQEASLKLLSESSILI